MDSIPTFAGDISLLEAGMTAGIFIAGYAIHELLHILPLHLAGDDYTVEILPDAYGADSLWLRELFVGTVVGVSMVSRIPSWRVILSALAPAVMLPFPLTGIAIALAYPTVDIGTALVLFSWFAVSLPSLADWQVVIQELAADGSTTEVPSMVSPLILAAIAIFVVGTIGTALLVRRLMGGNSSGSSSGNTARHRQSKGARNRDREE